MHRYSTKTYIMYFFLSFFSTLSQKYHDYSHAIADKNDKKLYLAMNFEEVVVP